MEYTDLVDWLELDPNKNPWTTKDELEIYENPWIKLIEYQVINPSGNEGIYGVVSFKGRAVGVIPYQDGRIWLVGQYRYAIKQYSWEIPEGGSPPTEPLLETAKRELLEETGLVAKHYEPIIEIHLSNSVTDEWGVIFLATGLEQNESQPEDTEELQVISLTLEEAFNWVESHKITDSLSIAAIYKLKILQLQGKL